MTNHLMDDAAIGAALSGKSARTGRRFREREWDGPVFTIAGRKYIRESDFTAFIEGRSIEPDMKQPSNLKSMLQQISERVLAERRRKVS